MNILNCTFFFPQSKHNQNCFRIIHKGKNSVTHELKKIEVKDFNRLERDDFVSDDQAIS